MSKITKLISEQAYDAHPPGNVIARQGDVIVYKPHTSPIAGALVKQVDNRVIIALGEATGHAHQMVDEQHLPLTMEDYALYETEPAKYAHTVFPGFYLKLNKRALLRHDEHPAHLLPARDYIVVIQHEGDEMGELRKIAD